MNALIMLDVKKIRIAYQAVVVRDRQTDHFRTQD